MEPLFEAKAVVGAEYALFNIYRLDREKYKATLVENESADYKENAPGELIVTKQNGKWKAEDNRFKDLGETLGIEIDAFNTGYGDLLGRIGI